MGMLHVRFWLIVLAGCLVAGPASGQLYRWTDAQGTEHYTGDLSAIPPNFRDSATPLSAPQPRSEPTPDASASTSLQMAPGAPITIEARLNGAPLTLIVDTGADRTLISPEALARAGMSSQPTSPVEVVGVTGAANATLVTLPLLDVAGTRIGPLPVIVHALPARSRSGSGSETIDGLLGRDVLNGVTLCVDTASGRATLTGR
ncbi:MAG: hypothetical protein DME04_08245 [Candidatus Rokuibacteriota bacterium]|nr:MAG: hypothetical protein DME04_08245 [Candidatus Rokubacteria bacterium]